MSETSKHNSSGKLNPFLAIRQEKKTLFVLAICAVFSAAIVGQPHIAMWVGFGFAAYSAIANDSIQTIGTFIASNQQRAWWQLWIFIGGIFLATMYLSWSRFGGPVHMELSQLTNPNGEVLTAEKDETVLRIELQSEAGDISFREMAVAIEAGELQDRESLGFDIRENWTVNAVSLGSRGEDACFHNGAWGPQTDKIESPKTQCWSAIMEKSKGLPEGATSAPLLASTYATGAPEGESWVMRQQHSAAPVGSIRINTEFGGDVSNQRLFAKGFDTQTDDFKLFQLLAPLFLILFTRLRMPVSTTFLLLSVFAASGKSIGAVTIKSLSGYGIAFVGAMLLWLTLGRAMNRRFRGPAHPMWRVAQWTTTGGLWSVWLMQDAANIAVFLPRSLTALEFAAFCGVITLGLGWLFRQGGEKIQEVVNEKASVVDVRAATVIDFLYASILYYFKFKSAIPMSTTWVFVGLLGGREIAMSIMGVSGDDRTIKDAIRMAARDLIYVAIGFIVSLLLAAQINPAVRSALFGS